MEAHRFRDDGRVLENFLSTVAVACPRCSSAAQVVPAPSSSGASSSAVLTWSSPRQLTCLQCGLTGRRKPSSILLGAPVDPYFQMPVFLAAPFRDRTLWAYNTDHLDVLRRYVAATVRERPIQLGERHSGTAAMPDRAARPMSMVEKLPNWMSAAGNREPVLRVLNQLRDRADTIPASSSP
jgi:hypothetical protein